MQVHSQAEQFGLKQAGLEPYQHGGRFGVPVDPDFHATDPAIESLLHGSVDTGTLFNFVFTRMRYNDPHYEMWRDVGTTPEDSRAYYYENFASDPDYARLEACEVLAQGGWDSSKINFSRS